MTEITFPSIVTLGAAIPIMLIGKGRVERFRHDCKEQNCKQCVRSATIRECHVFTGVQTTDARGCESKFASAS